MNTVRKTKISIPVSPTPRPPGEISPSFMLIIGIRPPIGVFESCIELTDPLEVAVVDAAHTADRAGPKRTSLPSMFPPGASLPVA